MVTLFSGGVTAICKACVFASSYVAFKESSL